MGNMIKRHGKKLFLLFWLGPILVLIGAALNTYWLIHIGIGILALLVLLCLLELVTRKKILATDDEIYSRKGR